MPKTNEWTEAEIKLFTALDFARLLEPFQDNPIALYRIAAEDCFVKDRNDNAAKALRLGVMLIRDCKVYRHTKEWEDAITFTPESELFEWFNKKLAGQT